MTRIVEHRSALPSGGIVEVHVRRGPGSGEPVFATVDVTFLNERLDPDAFPQALPVVDAFLQALSYAERVGIPVIWIDDPAGLFPPEKRPVRNVSAP